MVEKLLVVFFGRWLGLVFVFIWVGRCGVGWGCVGFGEMLWLGVWRFVCVVWMVVVVGVVGVGVLWG